MPRKIRELIAEYRRAGAMIESGRGSHRKIRHPNYPGCVIVSGRSGEDAKRYQEKDLRTFIELIKK